MFLAETEDFFQIIIVFGAVVFAAVKSILEKRAESKQKKDFEERSETEIDYEVYEAELERQRGEMGLPPVYEQSSGAPPPLPSEPEPFIPPMGSTPPPLTEPTIFQAPKINKPVLSEAEKAALRNFENRSKGGTLQRPGTTILPSTSTKARLKQHLSSPTAAREALLLAEIFGKPKSLKDPSA